jgi:NAD(P)H-dependent FMN reductase
MKLGIILGATRQGRQSQKQAQWVYNTVSELEDIEAEIVDLKDYPMPFFDEPISPRYNPNREIDLRAQRWLKKIEEFDAYVFVTPEYNHSIPGVLKNAMDYITWEMNRKPAAIVSHGAAGGARAAMHLKEILSESKAVPIPNFVIMHGMSEAISDEGELADEVKANPYGPQSALDGLLEELQWYSEALATARAQSELVAA